MQFGAIDQARQMAQVPEPNPYRGPQIPENPMMQANALQVPNEQIAQSQTDMAFDPSMRDEPQGMDLPPEIQNQLRTLTQEGAPPELIAAYLNQIAATQGG